MTFVAIPDGDVDRRISTALESRFGAAVVDHLSGRPWIYADRMIQGVLRRGSELLVRVGAPEEVPMAGPEARTACWRLVSRDGVWEARGSLSSSHRICWTHHLGAVLVSDRADTLAEITGSRLDPHRLMLSMCDSLPLLPFGASSFWQDVSAVLPGEALHVSGSVSRTARWWTPSEPDLGLNEAATQVRAALMSAVLDATAGADSVSCDLSGGLDSTSLVFLLHELGVDFSTFSSFSDDTRNPDRVWADRTIQSFDRVGHAELASPSENLQAFGIGDALGKTDEPLLWKSNVGYLQELAAALSDHRSPVHLNGLGGDELFTFLPGSLHAAWQVGLPDRRRLVGRARAMNRWNRIETARMLRQAPSFGAHLRLQGAAVAADASHPGADVCSWLPPVRVPRLGSRQTRSAIAGALCDVPVGIAPHATTHGHHQVLEGVAFQGSVVRTVNQLFGGSMTWASPMLEESVVTARLRMTDGIAGPEGIAKPLLARAMAPIMPADYFLRRDKGDYSHDVYREFARQRSHLRSFFADSLLAELGVLDMDAVTQLLNGGTQHNADLFDLERVVELERWSRAAA